MQIPRRPKPAERRRIRALETIVVSLAPDSGSDHLRFTAQLEVVDTAAGDVTTLTPRILDVINSYLRAIDTESIEDPQAMARLRAQMLRRIQVVTAKAGCAIFSSPNSC